MVGGLPHLEAGAISLLMTGLHHLTGDHLLRENGDLHCQVDGVRHQMIGIHEGLPLLAGDPEGLHHRTGGIILMTGCLLLMIGITIQMNGEFDTRMNGGADMRMNGGGDMRRIGDLTCPLHHMAGGLQDGALSPVRLFHPQLSLLL